MAETMRFLKFEFVFRFRYHAASATSSEYVFSEKHK